MIVSPGDIDSNIQRSDITRYEASCRGRSSHYYSTTRLRSREREGRTPRGRPAIGCQGVFHNEIDRLEKLKKLVRSLAELEQNGP